MNNIDVAEAMAEVADLFLKDHPPTTPITWGDFLDTIKKYIVNEEYEIKMLRRMRDEFRYNSQKNEDNG